MTAQENPAVQCKLEEAFHILNKYLDNQAWVAGDHMTIADISLITTISNAEVSFP
jgi:Glutathione S-transferase